MWDVGIRDRGIRALFRLVGTGFRIVRCVHMHVLLFSMRASFGCMKDSGFSGLLCAMFTCPVLPQVAEFREYS